MMGRLDGHPHPRFRSSIHKIFWDLHVHMQYEKRQPNFALWSN